MATVPYALTTRQKVKDLMNIQDTLSDAIIDQKISEATDFIESYCGSRRFMATDYVEIKDTYYSSNLFFNQKPVNSVAAVEFRTGVPASPIWMSYSNNGYLLYLPQGFIRFFTRFRPTPQAFRLTYNAGYLINWNKEFDITQHTLPFDLTQVCTELVALTLNTRNSQGILTQTTEGQSVTFESKRYELQNNHENILNVYKLNRIAP